MRVQFPGHYTPTEKEFQKIWDDGLIIFDTNVLLDFYRYSDETVQTLFSVIEIIKDRIWIPFQVSKEYHKNLNTVISEQIKKYNDSIKTLQEFQKQINAKRNHPFLSTELHEEINSFCGKFDSELELKRDQVKKLITANPSKEKLADFLDGKLGTPLSKSELKEIYKEGKERYNNKIPPGYKDNSSKPEPEKYNDLVIWKEILQKNEENDIPTLLVTGDKKEDWFQKELGLTIGPRPELIEEFKNVKDNLFYCYSTDTFLKYAAKYLGVKVEDTIVEEVGEYLSKPRDIHQSESNGELLNSEDNQTTSETSKENQGETYTSSTSTSDSSK